MTESSSQEHEKIPTPATAGNPLPGSTETLASSLPVFADNPVAQCSVAKMLWGHTEKTGLNIRVPEYDAADFDDPVR